MLILKEQHLFLSIAQYWVLDIPAPADATFVLAVIVLATSSRAFGSDQVQRVMTGRASP